MNAVRMLSDKSPNVAEMLAEIQAQTASHLMNSVLYQTSPPGSTGLPSLDALLINNATTRASLTSSLNRGDVVEIQGPAASGKTRLVYYLTMQCILPSKFFLPLEKSTFEVDIGGWEKAAVIMDTDGRWNVQRFKSLLTTRLEKCFAAGHTGTEQHIEELVSKSLRRLHIFRPKSSASLAATLSRLPVYHAERMPAEEIALLAIDSISSFYWIDRYNLEQQNHGPIDKKDGASPLRRVLIALQELRLSHGPVILLTNWGLSPAAKKPAFASDESSSPFYRQHLHLFPTPFETLPRKLPNAHLMPPITYHITLTLPRVEKVDPEVTSLQEVLSTRSISGKIDEIKGILRTVETGNIATFVVESCNEDQSK